MSHFLDRLTFFKKNIADFSNGHGVVSNEDRSWENAYRSRWQQDKVVRSTHGVNCTGSCSWKIFVKNGLITWEIQQTDYPRTRPDLPNHEPRGCPRGASYSWYVYSAQRVKYPLIRGRLMEMWREARKSMDPVEAWRSISQNPEKGTTTYFHSDADGIHIQNVQDVTSIVEDSKAQFNSIDERARWGVE